MQTMTENGSLRTEDTPRNRQMGLRGGISFSELSRLRARQLRREGRNERVFEKFMGIYGEKEIKCFCGKRAKLKKAHKDKWKYLPSRLPLPMWVGIGGTFVCPDCQGYKDEY